MDPLQCSATGDELNNMQGRAVQMGGTLNVDSSPSPVTSVPSLFEHHQILIVDDHPARARD